MQESLAEISLARLPLVVLNMARGAGRLLPGHAGRRPRRLPPSRARADGRPRGGRAHAARVPPRRHVAQPGAWSSATTTSRTRPSRSTSSPLDFGPVPASDWALDGSTGGTGRAKLVSPLGDGKQRDDVGYDLAELLPARAPASTAEMLAGIEPLVDAGYVDDADVVVVAFGTAGQVTCARRGRSSAPTGTRVGCVRPITLVPVPVRGARRGRRRAARAVAVYENNQGQMIDDVRLAVLGRGARCTSSAASASTSSGFGIAPDLDVDVLAARGSRKCMRRHRHEERIEDVDRSIPTDAAARPTPARLVDDFTPDAHRRRRAPPVPGLRRADRDALGARGHRRARRCRSARSRVFGIGCYTAFSNNLDVEVLQALHGRAPSLATGVKRAKPDTLVFTVQGDGDMVNEGLQEVLHAAARGEHITCFMLNNGVFGETGGHMTATTVLGQRTKNTLDGRDAEAARLPDPVEQPLAELDGAAYVARGAVNNAGNVARTKKMIQRAFETQLARRGLLVRRDPHHVPDGLVHRDPGGARLPRRHARRDPHDRCREGHRLQITHDTGCGDHTRAVRNSWARSPDASRTVRTNRNPQPRPRAANSDVLRSRPPLVKAAINTSALTARSLRGVAVRSLSTTMMRPSGPPRPRRARGSSTRPGRSSRAAR